MQLVTSNGFRALSGDELSASREILNGKHFDLAADTNIDRLSNDLARAALITICFNSFDDGRGFSLARRPRNLGYRGHLRAIGKVLSDQFRYALECGFDDVQISNEQAARQPETDWLAGSVRAASYRDKLKGTSMALSRPKEHIGSAYETQVGIFEQHVTHVRHFTESLFSFRITRPSSFRFRSGEFVMIGLPNAARPVFRAYSIASPAWDDQLEFYSIKAPGGALTQMLQHIGSGDRVLLKKKATGTLVLDALVPGRRLFLFATGTGIAPFASIVRDPEVYEKFDQIILTHTCGTAAELVWGDELVAGLSTDPLVGNMIRSSRLTYVTSLTREPHQREGRITTLLRSGALFNEFELEPIDPTVDRAMICGSRGLLDDLSPILEEAGLSEGSNSRPATYVVERAFVD